MNTAFLRIAEIMSIPIRCNAAAIIIAYGHPSGDPSPDPHDVSVTRQTAEAGKLMDIDVLDQIVIGQQRWVSLKERGLGIQ